MKPFSILLAVTLLLSSSAEASILPMNFKTNPGWIQVLTKNEKVSFNVIFANKTLRTLKVAGVENFDLGHLHVYAESQLQKMKSESTKRVLFVVGGVIVGAAIGEFGPRITKSSTSSGSLSRTINGAIRGLFASVGAAMGGAVSNFVSKNTEWVTVDPTTRSIRANIFNRAILSDGKSKVIFPNETDLFKIAEFIEESLKDFVQTSK